MTVSSKMRNGRPPSPPAALRLIGLQRRSRGALLRETALQAAMIMLFAAPAGAQPAPNARPTGGVVVAGSATITRTPNTTTINQATQRAAVNWHSFSVGSRQTVDFHQPNTRSVALNRVMGNNPSEIAGHINANGQVILQNQDGITFYKGAQINTAGLVATAAGISNKNFMAGKMVFDQPAAPNARVVNKGQITVRQAGLAALVAPEVANSGVITAKLGRVVLAGAVTHTLDLYGDGLVSIDVNGEVKQVPKGPHGKPVTALVTNTGTVLASGGRVELTARAAAGIVQNLVDAGGKVAAPTAGQKTGEIVLNGVDGSLSVSGQLDASGHTTGQTGGTVKVLASKVTLASGSDVDVSGDAGGGTALIGGNFHGAGPEPNAQTTTIAARAAVHADALEKGNGGRVAVWSDTQTSFNGSITARGGPLGGDGGFVETSSKHSLSVQTGSVNTYAPMGTIGEWLLDPYSVYVSSGGAASLADVGSFGVNPGTWETIDPDVIDSAASNVMLQAKFEVGMFSPISMAHNRVGLTAEAGGPIVVGAPISTRGGNITLIADDPAGGSTFPGSILLEAPLLTNQGGLTGGNVTLQVDGGKEPVLFLPTARGITTAGGTITIGGPSGWSGTNSMTITPLTLDTTGGGWYSPGANITFGGSYIGQYERELQLTLSAGDGDIYFGSRVLANALTISSARNVTATSYITASKFFSDTQSGNLSIPGGISTRGFYGTSIPGYQNAGPVTISAGGNVTIGTNRNSFIIANGGYTSAGTGGNGADVSIRAGGAVTLSGVATNGGIPNNGSSQGGNAGSISISGRTISLLGYAPSTFSGVPNLTRIALDASGGPSSDTTAFLPQNIGGKGGNITLSGHVLLRGGPGTEVLIDNSSGGFARNVIINGSVDATSPRAESLGITGGHGEIVADNIGASTPLNAVHITDNVTGSFGAITASTFTRSYSSIAFGDRYGPSSTTFSGPLHISGDATLIGSNLLFSSGVSVDGAARIGSPNLSAKSVYIKGPATILSDTTINTSSDNGPITLASIDGSTPDGQSLTLDAGIAGTISHGPVGALVPLIFSEFPNAEIRQIANGLLLNPAQQFAIAGSTPSTAKLPTTNPLPSNLPIHGVASSKTTGLGGYQFTAISQLNASSYKSGSTVDKGQACMATDFTMVARALGATGPGGTARVDQFWDNGAANFRGRIIAGHKITYEANGKNYTGHLETSDFRGVSSAIPHLNQKAANGQFAVLGAIKAGHPVLIGGSISYAGGGHEAHWMLGVGTSIASNGKMAVVANDPWTGTKVKIDPATGKVVDILDPANGTYYSLADVVHGKVSAQVARDFKNPKLISQIPNASNPKNPTPSYTALNTFDKNGVGTSGFVSIVIH